MTTATFVLIALFFGYHVGQIRIKEQMKKVAYMKNFDIHYYAPTTRSTTDDFKNGFCDGMTYIVEEVTNEHLTYWRR